MYVIPQLVTGFWTFFENYPGSNGGQKGVGLLVKSNLEKSFIKNCIRFSLLKNKK